jgi:hypothetical protein
MLDVSFFCTPHFPLTIILYVVLLLPFFNRLNIFSLEEEANMSTCNSIKDRPQHLDLTIWEN